MVVPPLLGLTLLLLLVFVVLVVDVTVATPGAPTCGTDDEEDVFVDTDDGSLSVNVTDVVVVAGKCDDDEDTGDKASSCVFEIIILCSGVRIIVDDGEGGLLCGILLLEQQSEKGEK